MNRQHLETARKIAFIFNKLKENLIKSKDNVDKFTQLNHVKLINVTIPKSDRTLDMLEFGDLYFHLHNLESTIIKLIVVGEVKFPEEITVGGLTLSQKSMAKSVFSLLKEVAKRLRQYSDNQEEYDKLITALDEISLPSFEQRDRLLQIDVSSLSGEESKGEMMLLEDAVEIVLDLAQQNILTEEQIAGSYELEDEKKKQEIAVGVVSDYFCNNIW